MLFADGGLALIFLAIWIYCFIDALTTPAEECRNLPKVVWVLLILIFDILGSVAWLVAGKNWNKTASVPRSRASSSFPEYDRPGRYVPTNPDDDAEFLAGLRKRADEQRRRASEKDKPTDAGGTDSTPSA